MSKAAFEGSSGKPATVIDCSGQVIDKLIFAGAEKGPLLDALEKGEDIVLKNLDRAQGLKSALLFQIIQLLIGKVDNITLKGPQNSVSLSKASVGRVMTTLSHNSEPPISLGARFTGRTAASPASRPGMR
jgi:hypothetical protein